MKAAIYELTARAYLAILLNHINLDKLITQADEATASEILAAVMNTRRAPPSQEPKQSRE